MRINLASIHVDDQAKALDFYKKAGNIITELDAEVQYKTREIGLTWAGKTSKENKYPWFARVHASQKQFDTMWRGADRWRSVKVKE